MTMAKRKKNRHHRRQEEEFAAEWTGAVVPAEPPANRADTADQRMGIGWFAIILSIASWFMWPAVLGSAGTVMGLIAYFRGQRSLGLWAIILGIISLVISVLLIPYYS